MITDLQRQLGIDASFFWQFLIFSVAFLILKYVYFSPYLKLIQKRESQTDGLSEEAKKLEEDSVRLEQEYLDRISSIRKKATIDRDALLQQARKDASALTAKARDQAKERLDSAREAAAKASEEELNQLKSHVSSISSLLMEKLTKKKVGL